MKEAVAINEALYEQVAGNLEKLIARKVLRAGDKVPSVRKLSREQGVSMSTVFQAYYLLENKGLIESRPRSGYYVKNSLRKPLPEPDKSRTMIKPSEVSVGNIYSDLSRQARDKSLVDFSVASQSQELLPVAKLNKAVAQALRENRGESFMYGFPPGHPGLLRQIAKNAFDWGGSVSPDDIVVTNGCVEALNLCLRTVAQRGDTIVIESPTYYGILQSIESLGMKVVEVATDASTGVCLDELEKVLDKTKPAACLFVLNFNNPLGSCMPDAKKEKLVRMLAERRIPLIEDDIYGDLYFGKKRPRTAKYYDQEGLVLHCSSFSKSISPGFRIGWTIPGLYKEKVERLKFMTSISTPPLLQEAMAHFLENGRYHNHLKSMRLAYQVQVRKYSESIATYFPAGTKISRPEGGFVLWVELPGVDTWLLGKKALEQRIAFSPGILFTAQHRYSDCLRISCGKPWDAEVERALKQIGSLAKDMLAGL